MLTSRHHERMYLYMLSTALPLCCFNYNKDLQHKSAVHCYSTLSELSISSQLNFLLLSLLSKSNENGNGRIVTLKMEFPYKYEKEEVRRPSYKSQPNKLVFFICNYIGRV